MEDWPRRSSEGGIFISILSLHYYRSLVLDMSLVVPAGIFLGLLYASITLVSSDSVHCNFRYWPLSDASSSLQNHISAYPSMHPSLSLSTFLAAHLVSLVIPGSPMSVISFFPFLFPFVFPCRLLPLSRWLNVATKDCGRFLSHPETGPGSQTVEKHQLN